MSDWEPEFTVDAAVVRRIAGEPREWRLLASGWDSDAYLADERIVWRVPRRAVGAAALRREALVLESLHGRLPAPVPHVTLADGPDGLPLARHEHIPGAEIASAVRVGARTGESLGVFLRELHGRHWPVMRDPRLPRDPLGRADAAKRIAVAHRRLDDAAALADVGALRPVVDAAAGLAPEIGVLCHGDLHIRHALVDEHGELAGVIDWGDACIGAPAMDLALVTALPTEARDSFERAYGVLDEPTWRFARMLGVMFAASLLAADPEGESGRGARRWMERLARGDR